MNLTAKPGVAIAVAAVAAFVAGLVVGLLIPTGEDDEAADGDRARPSVAVPAVCLEAIEAARQELGIRSQGLDIAARYPDLARRAVQAVRNLDTSELETVVERLNDLNAELRAAVEEVSENDFSTPARACEEAAGR